MTKRLEKRLTQELGVIFSQNNWSNVNSIFIAFRKLIEIQSLSKKYPTINFYADWLVHSKIDRNPSVYELLHRINVGFHGKNVIYIEDKKFNDYINVVIDALELNKLQMEIIDFMHFFQINMPFIEGDIKLDGRLVFLPENYDKTKFLVGNGKLDVGIAFITPSGHKVRMTFLIALFSNLIDVEVRYPEYENNTKIMHTLKEIKNVKEKINTLRCDANGLDPNYDYSSTSFLINVFFIERVEDDAIYVSMGIKGRDVMIKSRFIIQKNLMHVDANP